jgi:hypothetical protein
MHDGDNPVDLRHPLDIEYMLLAVDENRGDLLIGRRLLGIGLAGAALIDLYLTGRIILHEGRVRLSGTDPGPGEPVSGPTVTREIAEQQHNGKLFRPMSWVEYLRESLYDIVGAEMVRAGMMDVVTKGVLRRERRYVPRDPMDACSSRIGLRYAAGNDVEVSRRMAILAALAHATELTDVIADAANRETRAGLIFLGAAPAADPGIADFIEAVDAAARVSVLTNSRLS